jgi:cytochrome P450
MDLFSDGMRRNPYAAYERMRSGSPIVHLPSFDLCMILDFDGVKWALVDHGTFSSDLSHAPGHGNPGEWFIFFDPPRHTRLRALIAKAFTGDGKRTSQSHFIGPGAWATTRKRHRPQENWLQ